MEKVIWSYAELREALAFYAEDDYREFIRRGIPSERPFIGVRIPRVRELVGRIPFEVLPEFLAVEPVTFEEVVARGAMVARFDFPEMMRWFDSQVAVTDDWCACDTFCGEIAHTVRKHREEFLESLERLLADPREFAVRMGLVLLKCAYMDYDYLHLIFDRVEGVREREEYYIQMAVAWLLAECFIKFPEETLAFLRVSQLSAWTFNKTISKICDSRRVEAEVKEMLRGMRR